MRIIYTEFLQNSAKPGTHGTSPTVWAMAKAAKDLGHEVTIVAPYSGRQYPFPDIKVQHFTVPPVRYRNTISQLAIAYIGTRVVNKLGEVDVVVETAHLLQCYSLRIFEEKLSLPLQAICLNVLLTAIHTTGLAHSSFYAINV